MLLQFASFLVLARLLTPDDFGVVGMVIPFAILANVIANGGLQTTVIQRESLEHRDASSIFWSAAGINLLLAAGLVALGPLLARLYHEPRVTAVCAVWAAIIYGAALGGVHEALLKRQLRFGAVLTLQFAWLAAGTAAGILLALNGGRHWAVVTQIGMLEVGRSASMWLACGWRPAWPWTRAPGEPSTAASAMLRYWRNLGVFRLLAWFGDHPDRIVVGQLGGAAVLGLYESARRWAWYPFVELFVSLSDVAVATFSRVQEQAARYRMLVRHGITGILTLTMPATVLLFVEAEPIIGLLLGEVWLGAVPFVRLMCVAAFFGGLSRITQWLYLSRGDTSRQVRWAAVATTTMVAAVFTGANWGATGVAWGFTIAHAALALPAFAYCVRGSPVHLPDALLAAAHPAAAAITAGLVTYFARAPLPGTTSPLALIGRVGIFAVAYSATWLLLPGGRATVRDLAQALRGAGSAPVAESELSAGG